MDVDPDKVFVKCKDDTWAYFEEVTLQGLGKLNVTKLVNKVLKKRKARGAIQPDGSVEFKFNFI